MKNLLPRDEERRLAGVLRQFLDLAPLSMRAIEQEAGMAQGSLSHILRGRIRLGFHHLQRIGMVLDFSVRDFLAYAYGDPDAVGRMVASGAEFLERLPPAQRLEEPTRTLTTGERQAVRGLVRKLLSEQLAVLGIAPPSPHEVARRMARILELDEE